MAKAPKPTPIEAAAAAATANDPPAPAAKEKTRAIVTVPFDGVPDGAIYPVSFAEDDEIDGDLADAMIADGKAKAL